MIHYTTQSGLLAQYKAEMRAIELGYMVSKPVTECCRYDMIIDDGKHLLRAQVKYCTYKSSSSSGSYQVSLEKVSSVGSSKKKLPCYTSDEIDCLIVYLGEVDKLCYIPISVINGKNSITLRVDEPKNGQKKGIYKVDDYLW